MGQRIARKYRFFDQVVESTIELPELVELPSRHGDEPAIYIDQSVSGTLSATCKWLHHWLADDGQTTLSYGTMDNKQVLGFPDGCRFVIEGSAKSIICIGGPAYDAATLRHQLLDQVVPRFLAQASAKLVLHGGFVSIDGIGACLLAGTGGGKSTLCGALAQHGHQILSDDCLQVDRRGEQLFGLPSYNSLRLLPESAVALGFDKKMSGEIAHYSAKTRIGLTQQVHQHAPIGALFVLAEPEGEGLTDRVSSIGLSKTATIAALLKNSFCLDVHDRSFHEEQFHRLAALSRSTVKVYQLSYPRCFEALPKVVEHIEMILKNSR